MQINDQEMKRVDSIVRRMQKMRKELFDLQEKNKVSKEESERVKHQTQAFYDIIKTENKREIRVYFLCFIALIVIAYWVIKPFLA